MHVYVRHYVYGTLSRETAWPLKCMFMLDIMAHCHVRLPGRSSACVFMLDIMAHCHVRLPGCSSACVLRETAWLLECMFMLDIMAHCHVRLPGCSSACMFMLDIMAHCRVRLPGCSSACACVFMLSLVPSPTWKGGSGSPYIQSWVSVTSYYITKRMMSTWPLVSISGYCTPFSDVIL